MERRSKGKSKSKSKAPTNPVNLAEHIIRSGRKKTANAASSNNKDIVVNYPNGKVHFDLSRVDPTLSRTLIHMFLRERQDLKQSSILNNLRFARKAAQQKRLHHAIDNKEAINLFYHLFNKRRGRVAEIEQIKQLVDIVQSYVIEPKDKCGDLDVEMNQYNNSVDMMRRQLKTIHLGLVNQIKQDFRLPEKQLIVRVKQERIRKLAIDLFEETVVAIRQKTEEEVQIIYEQSYPEKICSVSYLKSVVGEEIYNRKKFAFAINYGKALRLGVMNTNFIVCHICKQMLLREYVRCTNNEAKEFTPTYKNSPNTYQRHILACDYCYLYEDTLASNYLDQQLDYFKYFQASNQFKCQRFFCIDCSSKNVSLQNFESIKRYRCAFCALSCCCKSCAIANELVRALAHYKKMTLDNYQQLIRYYELINFVNLNDQSVKQEVALRNTFRGTELKYYQFTYDKMLEEFQRIATAFRAYHQLYLHSPQLYSAKARSITPYMKEALTCLNTINRFQQEVPPKSSKSLNSVRKLVSNHEHRQRQRRNRSEDHQQSDSQSRKGSKDSKCNANDMTIKQKMKKYGKDSYTYSRYRVPLLNSIQIPSNQLTKSQEEQLSDMLASRLQKLSLADAARCIKIRTEIPYDESDYPKFINSSRSKIHTYYSLMEDEGLEQGIYHEMHDPLDGIMGVKDYKLFFDCFDDYLNKSSQSEEESYWQDCVDKSSHQQSNQLSNEQQNYAGDMNPDQSEEKEKISMEEERHNLSNDSRNMEQEDQNKGESSIERANQYQSAGSSFFKAQNNSPKVQVGLVEAKMEIQFPRSDLQFNKQPIVQYIMDKPLTKPKEDVMIDLVSSDSENYIKLFSSSSEEKPQKRDQKIQNTKELAIRHASLFQPIIHDKKDVADIGEKGLQKKNQLRNALDRIRSQLKLKKRQDRTPTTNVSLNMRQNPFPATKESKQDGFDADKISWYRHPMNQPD